MSLFLPASPQGLNKGKGNKRKGNMKQFQTKRESLKLGNASVCLHEADFILTTLVHLGLTNGPWKYRWTRSDAPPLEGESSCKSPHETFLLCPSSCLRAGCLSGVLAQPRFPPSLALPPGHLCPQECAKLLGTGTSALNSQAHNATLHFSHPDAEGASTIKLLHWR